MNRRRTSVLSHIAEADIERNRWSSRYHLRVKPGPKCLRAETGLLSERSRSRVWRNQAFIVVPPHLAFVKSTKLCNGLMRGSGERWGVVMVASSRKEPKRKSLSGLAREVSYPRTSP